MLFLIVQAVHCSTAVEAERDASHLFLLPPSAHSTPHSLSFAQPPLTQISIHCTRSTRLSSKKKKKNKQKQQQVTPQKKEDLRKQQRAKWKKHTTRLCAAPGWWSVCCRGCSP
jgi:hypothetical protein